MAARKAKPASTNGGKPAEPAELEREKSAPEIDPGLLEFLSSPPLGAEHVEVLSGETVVQQRQKAEVARDPARMAELIASQCERWAASERRAVRFAVRWCRDERALATQTIERGGGDAIELNGSVQSFLAQQQRNGLDQHKLYLESFEMVQDSWRAILSIANKRNEALERENSELRERLRKADDVGTELALETARAELEARGRTADILEKRVLPIAEAIAIQKIREAAAGALPKSPQASAAAAVPGVRDVNKQ